MTVASLTVDCLRRFHLFSDTWTQTPPEEEPSLFGLLHVETELGRFRMWVNDFGARNTGPSGLDYRLRGARYIYENIIALLRDLRETLNDGTASFFALPSLRTH